MVMEFGRADSAPVTVACGIAINAPILRPWLEETDSLGRGIHGRSNAIIRTIYRVTSRFFGKNELIMQNCPRFCMAELTETCKSSLIEWLDVH